MKTALITGATGGIGGAFARELSKRGWHLRLPVRNLAKEEAQELMLLKGALVSVCNVEDIAQTDTYLESLKNDDSRIDLLILSAGTFMWDDEFPGKTAEEQEKLATEYLVKANLTTKETVLAGIGKHFKDQQKDMVGIAMSSHAAHFKIDDPMRKGEEGYVVSMRETSAYITEIQTEKRFRDLILEEPGLIDTPMARKKFTKERLGEEPDWEHIIKPEQYVLPVLKLTGLF